MSDSRGLGRLYEQGALLYSIIASCPNATTAHNMEDKFIQKGLKNSITKKQKSSALSRAFDTNSECQVFKGVLSDIGYPNNKITSNIDMFFFGEYPKVPTQEFSNYAVSGQVKGVVGQYLILENNEWLYGYWLTKLCGYNVSFGDRLDLMQHEPQQMLPFI